MTDWKPGRRKAARDLETPYPGVPEHLQVPIWSWTVAFLGASELEVLAIDFRISLGPLDSMSAVSNAQVYIKRKCFGDSDYWLDLLEYLLEEHATYNDAVHLSAIFERGNSLYRVNAAQDGLEEVTTPEIRQQVQEIVTEAVGSPGDHLAAAWNCAYSRAPDPVKSYSESIKAAEAALAPVISPNDSKATLGKLISVLRDKPENWRFVLGEDPDVVLGLMRRLWDGQTSRHGGNAPTRHETSEEARAAVHIAASLVQFGVSGALSRR